MLPLAFNINIYFYSTDRLHNPHQTVAALDLGGGSTQITFAPKGLVSLELLELNLYLMILFFNKCRYKDYGSGATRIHSSGGCPTPEN